MMLNGSRLNARSLNGGVRSGVYGAAEAITGFSGELTGQRTVTIGGQIVLPLTGEFLASAQRYLAIDAVLGIQSDLAQTVIRNGKGVLPLTLNTELFFSKMALGFGSALLEVDLKGYVGVIFIDGSSVIHPMTVELDAARKRVSSGAGYIEVVGELSPSAIRRATAYPQLYLNSEGEASHIDDLGTRYIGAGGDLVLSLFAEDGGMIRQVFMGSADIAILSSGSGRLIKPTLAGQGVIDLGLQGEWFVTKYFGGTTNIAVLTEMTGNRRRPAQGTLVTQLLSNGVGYVLKRSLAGQAVVSTLVTMDGRRAASLSGSVDLALNTSMNGVRAAALKGNANIVLFTASEGYVNIQGEDIPSQQFYRPADIREFIRGVKAGTFTRSV